MPYKRFYPGQGGKPTRAPASMHSKGGAVPFRRSQPRVGVVTERVQKENSSTYDGYLKFLPLGGCGEVTRSCYVYEYKDDIVIIDMGLQWPEEDMPGIDYLIPNITYLKPKRKNIRGVIVTHGHYDHIGAIPHLL